MPDKIQTSFAGGELSPSLFARVDIDKYDVGAEMLRNFIVDFRGGASNRAGTEYITPTKTTGITRLIPFVVSSDVTYILEFGELYIRFITNGQVIESAPNVPYEIVTPYLAADLALLKFVQSADVMTLVHPSYPPADLTRLTPSTFSYTVITVGTSLTPPVITASTTNAGAGGQRYGYVVTSVSADGKEESLVSNSWYMSIGHTIDGAGTVINLDWSDTASIYNIYRVGPIDVASPDQTVYGYVGQSLASQYSDYSGSSDLSKNPPDNKDPFAGGENPSVVSYFQQRRVFGNLPSNPETLVFSQIANYKNFNTTLSVLDTDAITASLASREVNDIKALVPMSTGLIAFTSGGAVLVSGGQPGAALTPTSVTADAQASTGANDMPPIVVNYNVLFVQNKGSTVRDLAFNFQVQSYFGTDRSALANHLFDGYLLKEWAYAQEPHRLIWVVRDDGKLLTLAYVPDQEVFAWSQHDTQGLFKSVASVSEGNEDRVYVIVRRLVNGAWVQFIERISTRLFTEVEDAWFVDCGLTLPLTYPAATLSISGATGSVTCTTDVATFGGGDVGKVIWAAGGKLTITAFVGPTEVVATVERDLTDLIPNYPTVAVFPQDSGSWSMDTPVSTVTLAHLPNTTVSLLVDGAAYTSQVTNASGVLTLPIEGTKITAGIAYRSELKTLRPETPQGTIQGKRKIISLVTVRVQKTRGLAAGNAEGPIYELKDLYVPVGTPAELATRDIDIIIGSQWNEEGQLLFQQDYPLPATILGLVLGITNGDTIR